MSNRPVFFKLEFPKVDPAHPMNPEARILARQDGTYYPMTPNIVECEIDTCIDRLIDELNVIRKEAKRKFAAAKQGLREGTS
ncbi:hypothetical protein JXA32_04405 [Candidatus Sumerlaeota bacterium]|nr:hypothetical protein [Candidatus Sumerlaeota bacterium]